MSHYERFWRFIVKVVVDDVDLYIVTLPWTSCVVIYPILVGIIGVVVVEVVVDVNTFCESPFPTAVPVIANASSPLWVIDLVSSCQAIAIVQDLPPQFNFISDDAECNLGVSS